MELTRDVTDTKSFWMIDLQSVSAEAFQTSEGPRFLQSWTDRTSFGIQVSETTVEEKSYKTCVIILFKHH